MLSKEEFKSLEETKLLASNVKKMLNDDCELFIKYTNEPTGKIKQLLKRTKDPYLEFILNNVLQTRYGKK